MGMIMKFFHWNLSLAIECTFLRVEPGFLRVGAAFLLIGQRFLRIGLPRNVFDALYTAELFIFMLNLFLTGQPQLEMGMIMRFFHWNLSLVN